MTKVSGVTGRALLTVLVLGSLGLPVFVGLGGEAGAATARQAGAGTVLVTNLDTNSVSAIDATTRKVTVISGSSSHMNGPLGIAITPNGKTAWVTNSLGTTITPIDLTTLAPGSPVKVGSGPVAIAITENGATAYVSNFDANTVTPVNLRTNPATPESPIKVGFGPWSIAVSPNGASVVVSNSEGSTVSVISTASRTVTSLGVGQRPGAIAITPNGKAAYVASGHHVVSIDLATSPARIGSTISVGNGPVGIAVTANGRRAFTANVDNTVTPLNLTTNPATPESPIAVGTLSQPDGIAISPDGATAYAANASNTVTPINLTTNPVTPESPISVGTASFGIAIVPGQAAIARLHVTPGLSGRRTLLSAVGSTSPNDVIVRYAWNFGDGTSAVTRIPRTSHVYKSSGNFVASVVETTKYGTSLARTFTGQTVSNNGGGGAKSSATFKITALLQLNPPTGAPGEAVMLRDPSFAAVCKSVYVFFDGSLVAETTPVHQVIDDKSLVIPGNATLGRHLIQLSCTTSSPWIVTASFDVVAARNHLSEFSIAMPTFKQLKHTLAPAGGISLLMLLISRIIAAGFPSEWMDRTYMANQERITRRWRKRFPRWFSNRDVPSGRLERFVRGSLLFLGFIVSAGLINSVLDKSFGFNRTTLWLFLGQSLGIAIVTLVSQVPIIIGGVREHRRVHLQVLAGAMVIAIVCVAVSRLAGLSPGYCYGLIAIFLLSPEPPDDDEGKMHAFASVLVLIVSAAAFFATAAVFQRATQHSPSAIWLILDPALNVTFLGGFASLAFSMFPLPFLPGRHVAKWSKPVFYAISGVGLVGFIAVLLAPGSGSSREIHHFAVVPLLGAFVAFALVSVGFMMYFHLHPSEEREEGESVEESEGDSAPVETSNGEAGED